MGSVLHRPVCDLLGCTYPIVSAGMGVARSELVAAVSQAGGFGFLGMVREPVTRIRSEVEMLRQRAVKNFAVNLISAATERELLDAQVPLCVQLRVPVIGLFWDTPFLLVRDELVATFNELLEAERAGVRVTLQTGKEAPQALKSIIAGVQRDEARWCGVLTKAIQELQGTPSQRTGAFYDKAMAIPRLTERLAFLNRGQGWVVRKLEGLLPKIRDDALHSDLAAMLKAHRDNISLVTSRLQPGAGGETP